MRLTNIVLRRYSEHDKGIAEEWLRQRERKQADDATAAQTRLAKGSRDAAWVAAIAAIIAVLVSAAGVAIALHGSAP
jgi:hypothetical protein